MKYYIKAVGEADKGVVMDQSASVCASTPFDNIVEAEETCRMIIRSSKVEKLVQKDMAREKLSRLRLTLTVVNENGEEVNDHYWYHERKVVKE